MCVIWQIVETSNVISSQSKQNKTTLLLQLLIFRMWPKPQHNTKQTQILINKAKYDNKGSAVLEGARMAFTLATSSFPFAPCVNFTNRTFTSYAVCWDTWEIRCWDRPHGVVARVSALAARWDPCVVWDTQWRLLEICWCRLDSAQIPYLNTQEYASMHHCMQYYVYATF